MGLQVYNCKDLLLLLELFSNLSYCLSTSGSNTASTIDDVQLTGDVL